MKIFTVFKKIIIKPYPFILLFFFLTALVILSGFFELKQSKEELMALMKNQTHSMLETMIISSQNSLAAEEQLETVIKERLLNNAMFIKLLYDEGKVTNAILERFAINNNIFRINIFGHSGTRLYSNMTGAESGMGRHKRGNQGMINLDPIFSGEKDTLVLGIKSARFASGVRYAVALATRNRDVIVVNIEAKQLQILKQKGNLEYLAQQISSMSGIVFFALQDTSGIIVSSNNAQNIEAIPGSEFLTQAISDTGFVSRITQFNSADVFEAVHQFQFQDKSYGLIRIGVSLDFLNQLNQRILNRVIINSVLLLVAGVFVSFFVVLRQNYKILRGQYQAVESFSGNVIQTVSDSVIVFGKTGTIKIFNSAAEKLFSVSSGEVLGKPLPSIIDTTICDIVLGEQNFFGQKNCIIGNQTKSLLVSKNGFYDELGIQNFVLVIRDLTAIKRLEDQLQRKERLTAMGALASGVAHEVRNPLNSIGTIAQQLNKDFAPAEHKEEYHKLAGIIYSEVKRINATITNFLKFAKPDPLSPQRFLLAEFFENTARQYYAVLREKNITFTLSVEEGLEVEWDKNRIQQVIVNLIQNAIDAIEKNGELTLMVLKCKDEERSIEIKISDTGSGIPPEIKAKVFNLYFTTKVKGTGIGLSVVQKIVDEHNGIIFLESSPEKGTVFTIHLPVAIH